MRRGTTPTRKRTYPKLLTFCEATFWQPLTQFTVTPDVTETENGCEITITLTQEQTLSLAVGTVNWQIRGICVDGKVASPTYTEIVTDVHPDGPIEEPEEENSLRGQEPEEEPADIAEEEER